MDYVLSILGPLAEGSLVTLRLFFITLALAVPAALFYVRVFVLFHDCTHCSLFRTRWANFVVGSLLGVVTMTPYFHWRTGHGVHHASAGNLDRRSSAEIWTMTVDEYAAAPTLL